MLTHCNEIQRPFSGPCCSYIKGTPEHAFFSRPASLQNTGSEGRSNVCSLYRWPPGSLACRGHSAGPVKQMNEEDTENTEKQLCFVSLTGMFAQSQSVAMGSEGLHKHRWGWGPWACGLKHSCWAERVYLRRKILKAK